MMLLTTAATLMTSSCLILELRVDRDCSQIAQVRQERHGSLVLDQEAPKMTKKICEGGRIVVQKVGAMRLSGFAVSISCWRYEFMSLILRPRERQCTVEFLAFGLVTKQ